MEGWRRSSPTQLRRSQLTRPRASRLGYPAATRSDGGGTVSSKLDPAVRLLLDRAEIHDVIMRYAAGVDRRDFELVRACFTPDVTGWSNDRETMIEFISGVRTFEMTMHMMGNQLVEVRDDQ